MPVSAGARLGPYEILELVGAGGMGEVYRARDPRLGRDVAVKVLPAAVACDPERLTRFEREARAVAALNHPNILTVFDVGTSAPTQPAGGEAAAAPIPYVVTELLQGETLRELSRRRVPTQRQVLSFAVQIAQGLDAAHAKGIVHRDVKPENVFVTTDGRVKVLDFGLAKLADRVTAESREATESSPTGAGQVVGTLSFMSPEQVRGLPVDARTDVFSLGVLLYELLGGKHPFQRETTVATLTAILDEEPAELASLNRGVAPAVSGIVRRCLAKPREERYGSAHDVVVALEAVLAAPAGAASLQEVEEKSPYPGLSSFTEKDAAFFFGREAEVSALWERLRSRKLSGVIGPSGAGKTSFVRAGVVASKPEGWGTLVCAPGAAPFRGLGRAMVPELSGDAEALGKLVDIDDPAVAFDLVSRWRKAHGEALLVVDQFEELFTLNPGEVQGRFAGLLGRLAREADVHVLLSLRDDFLMKCADHEAIAKVFESLSPIPALSREALGRALEEPARKRGYAFEDEALVAEMVEAVEGARGALPLLAFAVSRLWEKRDRERKRLTRAAYEEIGGVAGALAQHAEATLDRIGAERQPLVREVFRNLVTAQGTRAVADRDELLSLFPERKTAEEVLRELVDARLLTSYEVEGAERQPSHHRIEVVHESLLTAWPRLVRWQAQDEEGALLRDQLKQAAHLWQEKSRSPDLLWTGTSFREYALWRERYQGKLTALEEDYAKAMVEKARRRKRLVRAAAVAVVLVSTGVAIAIAVSRNQAVRARERAETEARRAEASKLVALGKVELEADPTVTLAYARKSLEVHDTAEARRLAVEALWRGPVASVLPAAGGDGCTFLATSPGGQWLACSGWGSVITLFSADGKATRVLSKNRNAARPRIVLFSDDSTRLATFASGDPETVVWSVDGQEIERIRPGGYPRSFVGDDLFLALEPRPDRKEWQYVARRLGSPEERLLARGEGGSIDLRRRSFVYAKDRALFSRPLGQGHGGRGADVRIGQHDGRVADWNVHEETGWVVSFDEKREVRIWDPASGRLLHTLQGLDPDRLFDTPILDPRGTRLAWQSLRERAYALWDLGGPPGAEPLLMHKSEVTGDVGNAAFLPDGRWLVTALGTRVAFWPLEMSWPRVIRRTDGGAASVVFTPDSRQVVSCGFTASRVYPLVPDAPPARPVGPNAGSFTCYGVAMEPGGRNLLLAATTWAVFLAPLDGKEPQALVRVPPTESICPVAFDAAGRWAATAACYAPEVKDRLLHLIDRRTGATRTFPLPEANTQNAASGGVQFLSFVADGRLITGGRFSSLRRWDPETGANDVLSATPCRGIGTSADGRRFAVACRPAASENAAEPTSTDAVPPYELLVFDVATGARRRIEDHGSDIRAVALSPAGDVIATADSGGSIRVGRLDGSEPHLLVGAGNVTSLAFSPDGRWIASTSGSEIRLWPTPDPSKPPLYTLPRAALLAKLGSLTNVRVVEDRSAPTGYKLDLAPFPGWKVAPTW